MPKFKSNWKNTIESIVKKHWSDASSGHISSIQNYCIRWANAMENELKKNEESFSQIAFRTSFSADDGSLSGGAFRIAVEAMCKIWAHGDQLKSWYSNDYRKQLASI